MGKHRKTRRVYDTALTFENIHEAWHTVAHTCKNKRGVFEFAVFGHVRIEKILQELKERRYFPNKFRCFMIFEPKARLVMSQSIRDKIVNHFVTKQYLIPLLERCLIDTNVATRKKKGSVYATKTIRRYFSELLAEDDSRPIYALKIDVAKYFYTIDHEILFQMLRKKIRDGDVIEILRRIVNETNKSYINKVIDGFNEFYRTEIPHYKKGKGLSIGAMTSQFLAIFYLNEVDHYIKEELKCKYYIRYMDDFLILSRDKQELKRAFLRISEELQKIKLKVNSKSAIYNCSSEAGFPFLGYRYCVAKRGNIVGGEREFLRVICLSETVRRIRRRLFNLTKFNKEKYERSRVAYKGYFLWALPRWRGVETMR